MNASIRLATLATIGAIASVTLAGCAETIAEEESVASGASERTEDARVFEMVRAPLVCTRSGQTFSAGEVTMKATFTKAPFPRRDIERIGAGPPHPSPKEITTGPVRLVVDRPTAGGTARVQHDLAFASAPTTILVSAAGSGSDHPYRALVQLPIVPRENLETEGVSAVLYVLGARPEVITMNFDTFLDDPATGRGTTWCHASVELPRNVVK